MCEHIKGKKEGEAVIVGLCRKCTNNERFDRFQIHLLERQFDDNWWKMFQKIQIPPSKERTT
jgi:hypothetical protein